MSYEEFSDHDVRVLRGANSSTVVFRHENESIPLDLAVDTLNCSQLISFQNAEVTLVCYQISRESGCDRLDRYPEVVTHGRGASGCASSDYPRTES
jgi:hypothetical protein